MGTVYLVLDERSESYPIALKSVHKDSLDRRTLTILRNEFLSLASLRHPNVVEVYDFGVDVETSDLFFTCENVEGVSWMEAVNGLNLQVPLDLGIFLDLLSQVLRGLQFIHSRGVLHGDIKPDNVLVTGLSEGVEHGISREVKLIDFGLAKKEHSHGGEKILGTPYYVAPETILGSQVDRRTDLYSLGVVLYHLITGRVPFAGESNLAILRSHVDREPEPPRGLDRSISPELESIVLRLLRKRPEDRFQNALDVVEALDRTFKTDLAIETREALRCYVEGAGLVGREKELADLTTVFSSLIETDGDELDLGEDLQLHFQEASRTEREDDVGALGVRAVLLRGEKGLGKRRLASQLKNHAQVRGAALLAVECVQDTVTGDFDRFCEELESLECGGERPAPTYVRQARALADREVSGEPFDRDDRSEMVSQIAFGILEMSRERPVVLQAYDIHQASEPLTDVIQAVVEIQVENRVPGSRVLVSATALNDHDVDDSAVQRLLGRQLFRSSALEIKLERLSGDETKRFVAEALVGGEFPDDFVTKVVEESDGNSAMIIDILGFYIQQEKLRKSPAGWVLEDGYLDEDVPGRARRELREHISNLPPEALRLAFAFACLGEAASLDVACEMIGMKPREVRKLVRVLCAEKILEARADGMQPNVYAFVFVSARSMLYRMIPAGEVTGLHERAGDILEERYAQSGKPNAQSLAHHFLRSANHRKGIRFGADAADELAREFSPFEAIETYERVLDLTGEEDAPLVKRIQRRIASLRFDVGEYRTVIPLLKPLWEDASLSTRERAELYLEAARVYARLGEFDEAKRRLEASAAALGDGSTQGLGERHAFAAAELSFYQGRFVASLRHCAKLIKSRERIGDKTLLCRIYMLQAESYWLLDDKASAASSCQLAIRLLDGQRDSSLLAWSLFCRGKAYLYKHQLPGALKQFRLCLLLRQKMKTIDGQADCFLEIGTVFLRMGAIAEAQRNLNEAHALYERSGNFARTILTLSLLGEVYRRLGDSEKCQEALRGALRGIDKLGARSLAMETLLTFAGFSLDRGKLMEAERYLERARAQESTFAGTRSGSMRALSIACDLAFRRGEIGVACEQVAQGVLQARESGNPIMLAEFLIQNCYQVCRLGKSGEARRLLVVLYDVAKRHALRRSESWARLLEAIVLATEGKTNKAEGSFSKATELFLSYRNERDLAVLYLETGLWSLGRGDHEQAYLDLEEGGYLARKLDLSYLQCRYSLAAGMLEIAIAGRSSPEAEKELRLAQGLTIAGGYGELGWQVCRHLGSLYLDQGRQEEATTVLGHAVGQLQSLVTRIPPSYRASYLAHTGAGELRGLLEQVTQASAVD